MPSFKSEIQIKENSLSHVYFISSATFTIRTKEGEYILIINI